MIKAYKSKLKDFIENTREELIKNLGSNELTNEKRTFISGQLNMLNQIESACRERGRY